MKNNQQKTLKLLTIISMLLIVSVGMVTAFSHFSNGELLNDDDDDEKEDVPITGFALDAASSAALKYIGSGTVTDTEIGDEEGYYEVEITLKNGQEVDVHLDKNFNVLSTEYEDEEDED